MLSSGASASSRAVSATAAGLLRRGQISRSLLPILRPSSSSSFLSSTASSRSSSSSSSFSSQHFPTTAAASLSCGHDMRRRPRRMMSTTTPYPPGHAHQQSAFSSPASTSSTSSSKQAGSHTDHPASFRDALVHLEAFPEVREASRLRDDHHIQRALPLMHRAIEVLDTTLGKGTTLADAARYQLALYHIEAGDFGGARDILEALTEDVQMGKNAVKDVVSVRLLLAGSCLLQDRLSAAGAAAEDALTLVETRADAYTDLLARAYGMAGVCDMYGGDWEDAYDRLQKSAR
ncbi:tetratricopeptide-like helical, partial [Nannochloropsis oceanica]